MKIGITGIANGGKTVFLTSLLWHMAELESSDFSLSIKRRVGTFKPLNKKANKDEIFPFEAYREKLANGGQWPAKTKSSYRYTCTIYRKDWKGVDFDRISRLRHLQFSNEQTLDFYDFPGERIADAAIAAFTEYAEWSDHILHHFQSHADYSLAISPYLQLLDTICKNKTTNDELALKSITSDNSKMSILSSFGKLVRKKDVSQQENYNDILEQLIYSYKLVLSKLIHKFKPLISPSVFLLDESGSVAPMLSEHELASTRLSGLTQETQFVPLPQAVRETTPFRILQLSKICYKCF